MLEVTHIDVDITSDSVGGFSTNNTTRSVVTGYVKRVVAIPGTGSDQPDDNYSVWLSDSNGIELAKKAVGCDDTNTTNVPITLVTTGTASVVAVAAVDEYLTVTCENMGDSKKATLRIYYEEH